MKTWLCVFMCQFMFLKLAKKEGYWHYPYASFDLRSLFSGKLFTRAPTGLDYEWEDACASDRRDTRHQILHLNKHLQYWGWGKSLMHSRTADSGLCLSLTHQIKPADSILTYKSKLICHYVKKVQINSC